AMAALVEKETGVPCLFFQGAAGDLSTTRGDTRTSEAYGAELGRVALEVMKGIRCTATDAPNLQVQEEDFRFACRIDLHNVAVRTVLAAALFPGIVNFYEREYSDGVRPHLTVALLDGRIGLVGVSGEFFCGHALNLKRRARLEHLLFLGYWNDY